MGCPLAFAGRQVARKWFDRKVDAEQHLTAVEHSKLAGAYVDPRAGKVTFKTFGEQWRSNQPHRPGTAAQIETNLRRHAYPKLGDRPIGGIRQSEIQAWVKWLSTEDGHRKPLAASTVELIYTWVATIFKAAVEDRVIPVSPCRNIKLPTVELKKATPLPVETVEELIEAVPDRYRSLIVLGAGTGARISEALGLTNDRVDWIRRTVTIDRQLVRVDGAGAPVFGPVKRYRRISRRRGQKKAVVAVGRSILIIVWHLLQDDQARFEDLGPGFYDTRGGTERTKRNHVRQLEALGYKVTLEPAA